MQRILEVDNLHVSFHTYQGQVKAVRGVSFYVNNGETLAFVGESGCGKTVTAKAVMRLLKPPQAEIKPESRIFAGGENVLQMDERRLRQYRGGDVAMIFQDPMTSLNPTMTCGSQITESILLHKNVSKRDAWQEAVAVLKKVQMPDAEKRAKQYPHELSGGMRQRVMIAIALSCEPKLLIADEPTTALDVTIQAQIINLLRDMRTANTAFILVTHDLGVVANFADRIQVMYGGQVVERGSARDIFYRSRHPYTWALLSSAPKLAKAKKQPLHALKGTPPDLILPLKHCPFAARCRYCMPICRDLMPAEMPVSESHGAACWLMHPQAPKVNPLYQREAGA